jgi:hypothetical protein
MRRCRILLETMRTRVLLGVVIAAAVLAAGWSSHGGATAATTHAPGVLVARLPEVGTVYMRLYCTQARSLRFALGIRYSLESGWTRFRAGRFSGDRLVRPDYRTAWFPYTPSRIEWLAAAAGGENGVAVGWVRVAGYSAGEAKSCVTYDPPRVTIQIYPRSLNYDENSPRYLRHLIG